MITLCLSLLIFTEIYTTQTFQPVPLLAVQIGGTVTFQCFFSEFETEYISWFKHAIGEKPRHIATTHKYSDPIFYKEFNHERFKIHSSEDGNNLTISEIQVSDFAAYYCGKVINYETIFLTGTFLIIKESEELQSNSRTVVQQPVSDPVHPGDSVTLNCTVDSEICAGEHSVYWFRHGSGESLPGLIYTHGNRRDECEKSPEAGSPTHSCVYSLPKRNLSHSDAGIYYCAVATCGHILFGNGTDVNIEGLKGFSWFSSPTVLVLGFAIVFCVIFIIVLLWTRINKKTYCEHHTACVSQQVHDDRPVTEGARAQCHEAEMLNYAALHFADKKIMDGGRKRREMKQESVYSDVRRTT